MKKKKKTNLLLFSIVMVILFFIITEFIIYGTLGGFIINTVFNYPIGTLVVGESILAALVLIVMLLFKNSYVFTQKKEKFRTGLFYGLFFIITSCFFMLLYNDGFKSGPAVLNLALGYFMVGVCEEFLCRGWLFNEFLERFGNTKKGVWYSILISALIFGLIHVANIFTMNQTVVSTIIQVINAFSLGILFGVIYYKTKNIWSIIFLHGLWDFSLCLSDIAPVFEDVSINMSYSMLSLVFLVLMFVGELLCIIPFIKDIDSTPKKSTVIGYAVLAFICYMFFSLLSSSFSLKILDTYKYDNLPLEHYAVTRDNYDVYTMDYSTSYSIGGQVDAIAIDDYSFKVETKDEKLVLTNLITGSFVKFKTDALYDYIVIEEEDKFLLAYVDCDTDKNVFLNYIYLPKIELSNSDEYLDTIKNNMKRYLLPDTLELVILSDYDNDKKYLAAYGVDNGYYVLTKEDKMAILNRD